MKCSAKNKYSLQKYLRVFAIAAAAHGIYIAEGITRKENMIVVEAKSAKSDFKAGGDVQVPYIL